MKKHTLLSLLSAVAIFTCTPKMSLAADCSTEDGGPVINGTCSTEPNKFEQTINSLRLIRLNDDGSTSFVEISASPRTYDFASVSAGSDLGNFIAGAAIPVGTYVGLSPVIDKMATLNASTSVDGINCRTSPSGQNTDGGAPVDYTYDFTIGSSYSSSTDSAYNYASAPSEYEWLNAEGDLVIAKKFSPITITSDSNVAVSMELSMDAAEAADFSFNGSTCTGVTLGALNVTITTSSTSI